MMKKVLSILPGKIIEGKPRLNSITAEKAEEPKKVGVDVRSLSENEVPKNNGQRAIRKNSLQPGEHITFGSYAGEPIEWRVLEVKEDGTCVLLSEYGIEMKAYNDDKWQDYANWERCTLRKWLNGEFYQTAFTDKERAQIQLAEVVNVNPVPCIWQGSYVTQDYVYLLSLDEVRKYFTLEDDERYLGKSGELICMPTKHAVYNGAGTLEVDWIKKNYSLYSYELREGACCWWLRSPGHDVHRAADVYDFGSVSSYGVYVGYRGSCVRPVIVVRL